MKKRYALLLFVFVVSAASTIMGQNRRSNSLNNVPKNIRLEPDTFPTSLYQSYREKLDSLMNDTSAISNYHPDPLFFRLFIPVTFYHSPIDEKTKSLWTFSEPTQASDSIAKVPLVGDLGYHRAQRAKKQVNETLLPFYVSNAELVKKHEDQIMSKKLLKESVITEAPKKNIIQLFRPDIAESSMAAEADILIHKPNFWTSGGSGSLQFTQNYISSNWYKGGESTNALYADLQLFANYNDKEKIQLENSLEVKVGVNRVSSDEFHKYKMNTDRFRLYSKLGIQAAQKWYYTISTEFKTQLFKNYKKNSEELASAFMAPADWITSIGMDYKLQKKKINLSVFISPIAYNLRYVRNNDVDETAFGLDEGKKVLHDFGSKFQSDLKWEIIPSVVWNSRLLYFSNYEKVEAEWENTFDFVLNRYLSTKLFVHTRFDDGVKRKEGKNYFQLQELLSFGINYKW